MALNRPSHAHDPADEGPAEWGNITLDPVWLERRASTLVCAEMALRRGAQEHGEVSNDGPLALGIIVGVCALLARALK